MGQPYVGEIRIFAGNFAPAGWAFCDGSLLAISGNETLFTLIGTTYGGDGQNTFALPDLRGRLPLHAGAGYTLGQAAGEETVTVTAAQMPGHTHVLAASTANGTQASPAGNLLAGSAGAALYNSNAPNRALNSQSVQGTGGSQPHDNVPPFLALSFIISLFGVYPSQT